MSYEVSMSEVRDARDRISGMIYRTPLIRAYALDSMFQGAEIYLKPECLQITGSFKLRGAANKLLTLPRGELEKGVITASSGNHAQGVAYSAGYLGVKAVVVMPEIASTYKINKTRALGAEVIVYGSCSEDAKAHAEELQRENGYIYVHPYCDPHIIAGQGTVGLEIMEDMPDMELVVSPVGGGGLLSGVSLGVKSVNSRTQVIGVEPALCPRYGESRKADMPVKINPSKMTLADGIRVKGAEKLNFEIIQQYVDELICVSDDDIIKALRQMIFGSKLIIEPTSAIVFAAALTGQLPLKRGMKVCFLISGGNINLDTFLELIK